MSISAKRPGPTGYWTLVRENGDFRNLWFGQIVSLLGDWFNLIASASLVAALTQSGLAVGGLFVVRMLAQFLISPVAGVAADRYNRKTLLVLADLSRAITVLGFLLVRRPEHVWLLYALTAVQLAISGVFFPTRNAILPDIVGASELGAANALSSATWSVMLALGAALGGLVSGGWGIYPAFTIDALTFLLSAVFILRVRYAPGKGIDAEDSSLRAGIRQYIQGLNYLQKNPGILHIATQKAAMGLAISGVFQVIQVAIAEQVFVIGEGGGISLGLMYAFVGVGTGVGPILARRFTGDREEPMRVAIGSSYLISILGLVFIAPLASFPLVLTGTLLRGFGTGVNWVFSTQLLLQIVPDRVRGRVFSTEFALFTLANAASSAFGGWLLDVDRMGMDEILWGMAAFTLVPGAIWAYALVRRRWASSDPQSRGAAG